MRLLLGMLALSLACSHARPNHPPTALSDDVDLRLLFDGVWMHTTRSTSDRYPANGLLVLDGDHAVLVDTGWTDAQAETLMAYAEKTLKVPVTDAIITHAHPDRAGGMLAVVRRGLRVHALRGTLERHPVALSLGEIFTVDKTVGRLQVFFPGPGHSQDNVVVYDDKTGTLFGGCLVKDGASTSLGNTVDADFAGWPTAIDAVRKRFPSPDVVVPGHGEPGDRILWEQTLALVRTATVP